MVLEPSCHSSWAEPDISDGSHISALNQLYSYGGIEAVRKKTLQEVLETYPMPSQCMYMQLANPISRQATLFGLRFAQQRQDIARPKCARVPISRNKLSFCFGFLQNPQRIPGKRRVHLVV